VDDGLPLHLERFATVNTFFFNIDDLNLEIMNYFLEVERKEKTQK
jgi:hypothetical protein